MAIAATFTLKILQGSYSQLVDAEEGQKALNLSLSLELFRKCSIDDNDLPGRFSKILAHLWTATPGESTPHEGLKVTTSLGGTLLHDTLWKWREKLGGQPLGLQQFQGSPVSENMAAGCSDPLPANVSDSGDSHGQGIGIVAYGPTHTQIVPSIALDGGVGEVDLANEVSDDWSWGIEELSSLMAMDSQAVDLPLSISNTMPIISIY